MKSKDLTNKIIDFSKKNGNLFIKYSPIALIRMLDVYKLTGLEKFTQKNGHIFIEHFVAYLLSNIEHSPEEFLFLAIGLCDFYLQIKKKNNLNSDQSIKFTQLTDLLYENISDTNSQRLLPFIQSLDSSQEHHHQNLQNFPHIRFQISPSLPIMTKNNFRKDRTLKKPLNLLKIARKMNKLIVLGKLATSIEIYDFQLQLFAQIKPKIYEKFRKQLPILSMGYSQKLHRIGCIVKNVGLLFWEAFDNFQTQKVIANVHDQQIMYLQTLKVWITVNKNLIKFWDLQSETCSSIIKIPDAIYISCIYEIQSLKILIISIASQNYKKSLNFYQMKQNEIKKLGSKSLPNSGCHTIAYNQKTKTISTIGYSNILSVWKLDLQDGQLKNLAELKGHKDLITSLTNIDNTSVVISGDDCGFIRLWDFKDMRCIQALKISQQIKYLGYFNNLLIFCDKLINITQIDIPQSINQNRSYLTHLFDERKQTLFVVNSVQCYVIEMKSGRLKEVNVICCQQEQIYSARRIQSSLFFGTNRGNLYIIDLFFKQKKVFKLNFNDISQILEDKNNLCLILSSTDGKISVWMQNSDLNEKPKKTRLGFEADSFISGVDLYQPDGIIGITTETTIYLMDFQSMKIDMVLNFGFNILEIKFHQKYPIIFILDQIGIVYLIMFEKSQARLKTVNKIQLQIYHEIKNFKAILICKEHIFLGNDEGLLIKIDISKIFEENKFSPTSKTFLNKSMNIFRPAHQRALSLPQYLKSSRSLKSHFLDIQDFEKFRVKASQTQLIEKHEIIQIKEFINEECISILCKDGDFFFVSFKNLEIFAHKNVEKTLPFKWSSIIQEHKLIQEKIQNSLEILQKILNLSLTEEQAKQITTDQREINIFLSHIFSRTDEKSSQKEDKAIEIITKKKSCTLKSKSISLRSMQISKRLRNIKENNEKTLIKQPIKRRGLSENGSETDFFKPNYNKKYRKFIRHESIDQCQLYTRIQQKFRLSQTDKKIRRAQNNNNIFLSKCFRIKKSQHQQSSKKNISQIKSSKLINPKSFNITQTNCHQPLTYSNKFNRERKSYQMKSKKELIKRIADHKEFWRNSNNNL